MKCIKSFVIALAFQAAWVPLHASVAENVSIGASFIEANDVFEIRPLHGVPKQAKAPHFWIDGRRILYTTRHLDGWQARNDELSKIVVYDTESGNIEETPYRGELQCLSGDGKILINDYPQPYADLKTSKPGDAPDAWRAHLLAGVYGKPLSRYQRPKDHGFVNPYTCLTYSSIDPSVGDQYRVTVLREQDGALLTPIFSSAESEARLRDHGGTIRWRTKINNQCEMRGANPVYLSWESRYFISLAFGSGNWACAKRMWLLSPDGSEQVEYLPELFIDWARDGATGATYWTRRGMVIALAPLRSAPKNYERNGLFWMEEKSRVLKRVVPFGVGVGSVSLDGCKILISHRAKIGSSTDYSIVELCKKGNRQ